MQSLEAAACSIKDEVAALIPHKFGNFAPESPQRSPGRIALYSSPHCSTGQNNIFRSPGRSPRRFQMTRRARPPAQKSPTGFNLSRTDEKLESKEDAKDSVDVSPLSYVSGLSASSAASISVSVVTGTPALTCTPSTVIEPGRVELEHSVSSAVQAVQSIALKTPQSTSAQAEAQYPMVTPLDCVISNIVDRRDSGKWPARFSVGSCSPKRLGKLFGVWGRSMRVLVPIMSRFRKVRTACRFLAKIAIWLAVLFYLKKFLQAAARMSSRLIARAVAQLLFRKKTNVRPARLGNACDK